MNNGNPQARANRALDRILGYPTRAVVGWRKSAGEVIIDVPGRKNYVYVTRADATVLIARIEANVPRTAFYPVRMELQKDTWVIVSRDTTNAGALANLPDNAYGVPQHPLSSHMDADFSGIGVGDVPAFDGTNWVNTTEIPVAVASTIHAATGKSTPADNDELALVDSAASNVLKKLTWANLKATIATYYNTLAATLQNKTLDSTNMSTLTAKTTPIDADSAVIVDSAASNVFKRTTYTNIKAFLKTYFDTLYGLLGTANTWTKNNTISSTSTSGNALNVTRDLAAASTDAPVVSIVQDNSGDDQPALRVQQDGTGDILQLYDGVTLVVQFADGGKATFVGDIQADGNIILSAAGGTQDYKFTTDGSDAFVWEGMGTGKSVDIRINPFDADGTDNARFSLWGVGKTGSTFNRERLNVGYLGTAQRFEFESDANGTGTVRPIVIWTKGNADQFFVDANGRIGINTSTPSAKLSVRQSSTTAAIPVLKLTQSDLSEEMIRFETTVGAGNPVDTAALGTYYGKVRVYVEGVGAKYIALYNS